MRIPILWFLLLLITLMRFQIASVSGEGLAGTLQDTLELAVGMNIVLNATADSSFPVSFQWQKNGIDIPGATGTSLTIRGLSAADAGMYSAVASNSAGSSRSNSLVLQVASALTSAVAPVITAQPEDLLSLLLGGGTFRVTATGSPAPYYQWLKNGMAIPGATSPTLSLSTILSGDRYSVVVTNSAGSVTSREARSLVSDLLQPEFSGGSVSGTAPVITRQPGDLQTQYGNNVVFSVAASGSPTPTYAWYKDGTPIAGATSAFLSVPNVQSDATYMAVASNSAGSVSSRSARLTVLGSAPVFTEQPVSQAVTSGSSVTFSAAASGAPTPTFQWRKEGVVLPGATSPSLYLDRVTKNDEANYDVIAANSAGETLSNRVSLIVQAPAAPASAPATSQSVDPIPGVVLRANYTLTVDPGMKRTVGFVLRGDTPKTILVRAVGPTLGTLGVSGAMADPVIEFYSGLSPINGNDNWGGSEDLMRAFAQAGATPLMSPDSRDAAFVTSVAPGAYSVVVSGADGGGGTVLVEVYEFPANY